MFPQRLLKILIVEDSPVDREIYKECLKASSAEFQFAEADSAAQGISLCRSFHPDCVLLDYDLPDQNGLEVLAHFRLEDDGCAVVMLTAYGGEDLAVRAMKAGVTDYLPKRYVSPDSLSYTIANAVQKHEMQTRIEQHRAELERSQRRYETLLEAMPQMVWTADAEGQIQYANRYWTEYTGLTLESAGRLGWDDCLHPEDKERTWETWNSAAASGSIFEIEHRVRRAGDNSYRWQLVRAIPMKNQSGQVVEWFGTCTEVENQKRAEQARQKKEKLEGLGLLAGGIAHDFNNLLVSILGGASFVLDTLPANHPTRDILVNVVRAGERAAELTRKMLAYSGRLNRVEETLDLDQFIRETCRYLRPGIPSSIQLQCEGGEHLPPLHTDAEQLRRIIVELVMNSVEAIDGKPGRILVTTKRAEIDPEFAREGELESAMNDGVQFVAIEVQDTGCGIDPDMQAKIFDPFFSTKFTGRGLGLAAVKGVVRSSGGAIRVCSRPGAGALFQIVLPACHASQAQSSRAKGEGR